MFKRLMFYLVFSYSAVHASGEPSTLRNRPQRDSITWAAHYGNIEGVRAWLRDTPNSIVWTDKRGQNALFAASWNGHEDIVLLLLDTATQKHRMRDVLLHENHEKDLPLVGAASGGHLSIMRLLIGAGEEINEAPYMLTHQDKRGDTISMWAISKRHADVASFLIDKAKELGVLPTILRIQNREGLTLLMEAVMAGLPDIVEKLMRYGHEVLTPDDFTRYVNAQDVKKRSALHMALRYVQGAPAKEKMQQSEEIMADIVRKILVYPSVNIFIREEYGEHRNTPIFWAAYLNKQQILDALRRYAEEHNADMNQFRAEQNRGVRVSRVVSHKG